MASALQVMKNQGLMTKLQDHKDSLKWEYSLFTGILDGTVSTYQLKKPDGTLEDKVWTNTLARDIKKNTKVCTEAVLKTNPRDMAADLDEVADELGDILSSRVARAVRKEVKEAFPKDQALARLNMVVSSAMSEPGQMCHNWLEKSRFNFEAGGSSWCCELIVYCVKVGDDIYMMHMMAGHSFTLVGDKKLTDSAWQGNAKSLYERWLKAEAIVHFKDSDHSEIGRVHA